MRNSFNRDQRAEYENDKLIELNLCFTNPDPDHHSAWDASATDSNQLADERSIPNGDK